MVAIPLRCRHGPPVCPPQSHTSLGLTARCRDGETASRPGPAVSTSGTIVTRETRRSALCLSGFRSVRRRSPRSTSTMRTACSRRSNTRSCSNNPITPAARHPWRGHGMANACTHGGTSIPPIATRPRALLVTLSTNERGMGHQHKK